MFKTTDCSYRELGFNSQHPHDSPRRSDALFWPPQALYAHGTLTTTQAHTHKCIKKREKKKHIYINAENRTMILLFSESLYPATWPHRETIAQAHGGTRMSNVAFLVGRILEGAWVPIIS